MKDCRSPPSVVAIPVTFLLSHDLENCWFWGFLGPFPDINNSQLCTDQVLRILSPIETRHVLKFWVEHLLDFHALFWHLDTCTPLDIPRCVLRSLLTSAFYPPKSGKKRIFKACNLIFLPIKFKNTLTFPKCSLPPKQLDSDSYEEFYWSLGIKTLILQENSILIIEK